MEITDSSRLRDSSISGYGVRGFIGNTSVGPVIQMVIGTVGNVMNVGKKLT